MLSQNFDGFCDGIPSQKYFATEFRHNLSLEMLILTENSVTIPVSLMPLTKHCDRSPSKFVTDSVTNQKNLISGNFPSKLWRTFPSKCPSQFPSEFNFFRRNIFFRSNFPSQLSITNYCDGPTSVTNILWQLWRTRHNGICDQSNFDGQISVTNSVTIPAFSSQFQHFSFTIFITIQHFFCSALRMLFLNNRIPGQLLLSPYSIVMSKTLK